MRVALATIAFASCLLSASSAGAQGARWHDDWARVHPIEIGVGAVGLAAAGLGGFVLPEPKKAWEGRNDFDESIRDGLRASGQRTRATTAAISDGIFYGLVAYPVVVDAMLVTWIGRGDGHTAGQLALVDLFAIGASGLFATASEQSGRERPFGRTCEGPEPDDDCAVAGRYRSFFSGHTVAAFTGAGLVCVQHRALPLYGSRAADILTCAGALALASTNAVFRITSDNHYASDVLIGASVGLAAGYVVPSALHFGWRSYAHAPSITPAVDGSGARVLIRGVF